MNTSAISTEKKVDMIFEYIFSNSKDIGEENFWNILKPKEVKEMQNEGAQDFSILKNRILINK